MLGLVGLVMIGVAVVALTAQLGFLATRGGSGAIPSDETVASAVRWGVYINPDDPRGWLPKTTGVGWTVNFRSAAQAGLFFGLIAIAAVGALLLTVSALSAM